MTEDVIINPQLAQEIYEIVASNRTKTRGSRITLRIDNDGEAIRIANYEAVLMEPQEIKRKGLALG